VLHLKFFSRSTARELRKYLPTPHHQFSFSFRQLSDFAFFLRTNYFTLHQEQREKCETFAAFLAGGCVCTWLLLTERIEHMFRCCAINSSLPQTNNQMRKKCRRAHKRQLHCRKKCFYAN
jgi:hypothetical protein